MPGKTDCVASLALAATFVCTPAKAVTLTNLDTKTHAVEVRTKSARRSHQLPPTETLSRFCEDGCIIRLNDSSDDDYILEGTERISIEGGLVYYDGEEADLADNRKSDSSKPAE